MINVEVLKVGEKYSQIKVDGHASKTFGEPGKNILCSAISALTQSLYIFLHKRDLVEKHSVKSGHIFIETKKAGIELSNPAFELVLDGILVLRNQYPSEFRLKLEAV